MEEVIDFKEVLARMSCGVERKFLKKLSDVKFRPFIEVFEGAPQSIR